MTLNNSRLKVLFLILSAVFLCAMTNNRPVWSCEVLLANLTTDETPSFFNVGAGTVLRIKENIVIKKSGADGKAKWVASESLLAYPQEQMLARFLEVTGPTGKQKPFFETDEHLAKIRDLNIGRDISPGTILVSANDPGFFKYLYRASVVQFHVIVERRDGSGYWDPSTEQLTLPFDFLERNAVVIRGPERPTYKSIQKK